MRWFYIERPNDTVNVLLMPHKNKGCFSFVNITKGHICNCVFSSEEEAIKDLNRYKELGKIINYRELT